MGIPEFIKKRFIKIDKELIIIFLLVAITAIIYFFVFNQRAFLNFFFLPVLLGRISSERDMPFYRRLPQYC